MCMDKYVVEVKLHENNGATLKAKEDVATILVNTGWKKITFESQGSKLAKIINGRSIKVQIKNMKKNSIVLYQYPTESKFLSQRFFESLKYRPDITKYCILHDVESLRHFVDNQANIDNELKFFNQFDGIIVHNSVMKSWLTDKGVHPKLVNLEIFDYLGSSELPDSALKDGIIFAGSLDKAKYFRDLRIKTPIKLFGPYPEDEYPQNIEYMGQFAPDKLAKHLEGKYGLIWDGNSAREISGIQAYYTRYNNPHKTSLYLSCGLPVIVWKEAAISKFIEKEKVGFSINSLDEIDHVISKIDSQEYQAMRNNARKIGKKIRKGYYLLSAVNQLIKPDVR